MPDLAPQGFGDLLRALEGERDHVDDGIGVERRDPRAERPRLVLGDAIRRDGLYIRPGSVRFIGLGLPAADIDDFVARLNQHRHQIGAHVTAASDNDDPHIVPSVRLRLAQRHARGQPKAAIGGPPYGVS